MIALQAAGRFTYHWLSLRLPSFRMDPVRMKMFQTFLRYKFKQKKSKLNFRFQVTWYQIEKWNHADGIVVTVHKIQKFFGIWYTEAVGLTTFHNQTFSNPFQMLQCKLNENHSRNITSQRISQCNNSFLHSNLSKPVRKADQHLLSIKQFNLPLSPFRTFTRVCSDPAQFITNSNWRRKNNEKLQLHNRFLKKRECLNQSLCKSKQPEKQNQKLQTSEMNLSRKTIEVRYINDSDDEISGEVKTQSDCAKSSWNYEVGED